MRLSARHIGAYNGTIFRKNIVVCNQINLRIWILRMNLLLDKIFEANGNRNVKINQPIVDNELKGKMIVSAAQPCPRASLGAQSCDGRKKSFGYTDFFFYLFQPVFLGIVSRAI